MTQAQHITGKEHSFGRGLLLTIVTLGIYALYWHYTAYKELLDQFNVGDFPTGLYIASYIPIVNFVTQPLFMSRFIDHLNTIRHQRGLPQRLSLGSFLAWYILGAFIIIGPFVAYNRLQTSINEVWRSLQAATPEPAAQGQTFQTQ